LKIIVNTKDLPREQWLEYRKKGIGGSDVGVITGMNKYKSPFTLYLEKIGEFQDDEQSESAYWGNTLEDIVAQEFSKRAGLEVRERHELLQHDDYDFMIANLDREVICPNRGIGVLECKTASEYLKDEWMGDKIPDSYYLQVQHYLAVTGYPFAYIAVLIGGNKFVYKDIERDEEVIHYLIQLESQFWNEHVLKRIPPAIDQHDSTTQSLNALYSISNGNEKEISPECLEWIEQLKGIKRKIKKLEEQKQLYENQIKYHLGESEIGVFDGEAFVTWKPTKKGNRVLKIKEVS
jgi:putative phage-type endonuclease